MIDQRLRATEAFDFLSADRDVMRVDKRDVLAIIGFLGLALIFFSRFLDGQQILAFKDLSRFFYPLRYLMVEQVKAGHIPLWNPYIFCGFPLLATLQPCFFYPLSMVYYMLPYHLAFNYYTVLHYFLAACFMHFLLRHYGLSREASFTGASIFAFSGYLLSVSNMNTSLSSVIWAPLILLFFDRLIKDKRFINLAVLGIFLAIQFLGGEPTVIYVTLLLLAAYGVVFSGSWRAFVGNLGYLILSGAIALGLTAVQLLPFLELARLSDRVVLTGYEMVTLRSFPPREMITFLFPYFFGNPAQFGGYSAALLGRVLQDWLISPYIGILPLVFVFLSFKYERKRLSLFFAAAALVSLILAFGKYTPVYRVFYLLPGISLIRYPVKYLFAVTFCLSVLASFGLDWLRNNFASEKLHGIFRVVFPVSLFLLAGFLLAFFFRLRIFLFFAGKYPSSQPKYFFDLLARIIEFNLLSFLFIVVYLLGFSLLVFIAYKVKIKKSVFFSLVILLIIADLFSSGSSIAVLAKKEVFDKVPEGIQALKSDRSLFRFFYTPELEKQNRMAYGEDYSQALSESKDNLAANWHIPYHLYDFYGYESIRPWWMEEYYSRFQKDKLEKNFHLLSRLNVKYIASSYALKFSGLKRIRHKSKFGLDLYLYENKNVFPRAYFQGERGASVVKYLPGEICILAGRGTADDLFLGEAYYPGWKVFVDGKLSRIDRGMDHFCKVRVPAGEHEVRFVYDPLSFRVGAWISILTLLGLTGGGYFYYWKSKNK